MADDSKERELIALLRRNAVLPILTVEHAAQALKVAEALLDGGLPVIEITLRTNKALPAIKSMREWFPEMLIGAGTVLDASLLKGAEEAGAQFVVTPGLTAPLIQALKSSFVPAIVGAQTASEMMRAAEAGFQLIKWYPAEASGGAAALDDLSRIFSGLSFVPTGKITKERIPQYLALKAVAAVGGSWVVPASALERNDFDTITENARTAISFAKR